MYVTFCEMAKAKTVQTGTKTLETCPYQLLTFYSKTLKQIRLQFTKQSRRVKTLS